jgi:hypothetical protein
MAKVKSGFASIADSAGWRFAYWPATAALTAGVLYAAFVLGPEMRAEATDRLQQTIADEDRAFCEKLGMRAETSEFVACAGELGIIRQRQADRDAATAQGLL